LIDGIVSWVERVDPNALETWGGTAR
jgi:hypothetical protein